MVIKGINIKRRELSDDDKIGDNVVETLKFWGVCCFLQEARTAQQHCMRWVGEGKLHFTLLKWAKCQEGPIGQTVSTNFAADYRFKTA